MLEDELVALVRRIQAQKTEKQTIELKSASKGSPEKLFDSLSSFSNQDEGGIIIFGIDEKHDYQIVGVYDSQDLQKRVTEQCKQMEPVVRALFTIAELDGKTIVSAEIPGADMADRPVFYRGVGRIRGSYIRVGDSDEPMTEYEIYSYEAFRKSIRDELRTQSEVNRELWNKSRLEQYLSLVKQEKPNLALNVTENDILELMGVMKNGTSTIAGLMSFSLYPQTLYPQLCITAVRVPGTQMGDTTLENARFLDNLRITGAIPDMLDAAVDFVRRNSRTTTYIDERGRRVDKPEYPLIAIREAVLNALIHRDYSIYTENRPITLEMYSDRLEIRNPGGLYGRTDIHALGHTRPETRNPVLANILELLKVTENRYSGIPTIQKACRDADLAPAEFSTSHGDFKFVLYNQSICSDPTSEKALLQFCKTPRSRAELASFTGKTQAYTINKLITPLVAKGALQLTIPDKPKSSLQRYVTAEKY